MDDALAVVRRFVDEFQTLGKENVANELLSPDFTNHTPFPGFGGGRDEVIRLFTALRTAFPDLRVAIDEQFVNGDMVATRKTFHGTHLGEFLGARATGKKVKIRVVDFVRVKNGKMCEHWNVVDLATLISQLQS
jgi:steroid delta-isomerase-like uncharacterized protein